MMTLFTLMEALIIVSMYCFVLEPRYSRKITAVLLLCSFGIVSALSLAVTDLYVFQRCTITVAAAFLCCRAVFRTRWYICLFCTLLVCYELVACDIVTSNLLSIIFGNQLQVIVSEQSGFFAFLGILSKLVALIVICLSIKFIRKIDYAAPGKYWQTLNIITALFYLMNLFFIHLDSFIVTRTERTETTFICASYILITVLVLYLFHELGIYYTKKAELIHSQIQSEFFRMQLAQHQQSRKEMSVLRHDINNHLLSLRYLAEQGKNEEMEKYIDDLLSLSQSHKSTPLTGIELLDAIIAVKKQIAAEAGTDIILDSEPLKNPPVLDNCKVTEIFSNLLDNAVNAAASAEDRTIKMKVSQGGSNLTVQIVNHYSEKKTVNVITDHVHQGLGLGIARSAVKESGGCFDYFMQDGLFTVNIILPVETE